jgi:CHAT domain-containing protein
LPFRGDILLASRPVIYGLDLAVPTGGQPPGRRALVVADPLGNLPAAVREADVVTAALRGQSWTTDSLRGEKAEEGAVRRALGQVDLLHYAGHGTFSGFGGWESVLPLAGSTRLTLGDVLTLGRAPRWVVLSGCETGQSSADAPVEGLGLAQAFLLAGSRSVIAATRPVGDRAAEGLFAELYQHWGPAPDLAVLLQRAQLALRQRAPGAGWASFRLFEP